MTLPYDLDLRRPPPRLGPRMQSWETLAIAWGASFAFLLVVLTLGPSLPDEAAAMVLVPLVVAAFTAMVYVRLRLEPEGSYSAEHLGEPAVDVEDPVGARRPADRHELAAHRDLKLGRIGRVEYERIIARRHLVHGEISKVEYHSILSTLADQDRGGPGFRVRLHREPPRTVP